MSSTGGKAMTKVKVGQKWRHDEWSAPREATEVGLIAAAFIGGGMSLEDGMPQFPERWTLVEDVPEAPADLCPVVEVGATWRGRLTGDSRVIAVDRVNRRALLSAGSDMYLDGDGRPRLRDVWTFVSGPKREEPKPVEMLKLPKDKVDRARDAIRQMRNMTFVPPPRCAPGCRPDAPCRTKDVCPVWNEERMVKGRRLESAFQARMFAELASNWGLSGNDPGRIPDYWAQRNARLQAELRRGRR